jgi:HSP20 family protein
MDIFDEDRGRRRRENPFDFIDDDKFERIFDKMQKLFESTNFKEMIEETLSGSLGPNKRYITRDFSINMAPIKPKTQKPGKHPLKQPQRAQSGYEEREPLADIIERDKEISITFEIPSVEKKDIDLNVTDYALEIMVNTPKRKYHKHFKLPCSVKPKTAEATYKNGVLDVVMKRKKIRRTGSGDRATI